MTTTEGSHAATTGSPRLVLPALCVTVTISYGTLYYAFAVLAPAISDREDWSLTWLTAGFSTASLITGVVGIVVGRIIQHRGPRGVMVTGAVLGTVGLLGLAASPSAPVFLAALALCGIAAAGLFYAPAFAAITQWYGERRLQALTALTLVAGFASTIFAPVVTQLNGLLGWRWTYTLLAALLLLTALPMHAGVLAHPWHPDDHTPHATTGQDSTVADRAVLRSRRFLLIAFAGALVTLAEYASLVGLIPLLDARGMSDQISAWVLGIGGAGQVLGRLFYARLARVLGVPARASLVVVLVAVPIGLLALVGGPAWVLIVLSVAAGLGRGLFTLVAATLVTDVWGPERYAALNGVLSAPLAAAGALGPFVGAAGASLLGGYPGMFALLSALALLGAVLMGVALKPATSVPDNLPRRQARLTWSWSSRASTRRSMSSRIGRTAGRSRPSGSSSSQSSYRFPGK
jgi:MFS family permease